MNQNSIKKYSSLSYSKYRNKYGLFLAEGYHLIEELLKSNWEVESIITSNPEIPNRQAFEKVEDRLVLVKPAVIEKIATTRTPQEILAIVKIPPKKEIDYTRYNRIIIADAINDPGNMGTIIRCASAFGFGLMVTTPESADIYNPKVVRASQGAIFNIDIVTGINTERLGGFLKPAHRVYSLAADGDNDIHTIEPGEKSALIIGAETSGVSGTLRKISDCVVRIPQKGKVDSLNAAVAGGIAMYYFRSEN